MDSREMYTVLKLLSHYEELRQDIAKNTQIWCSWKILHVIVVYSCLSWIDDVWS